MAGLDSSVDQLSSVLKVLKQRWEDTKPLWNDPVSESFEKIYWTTLEKDTHSALKEMQQLSQVVAEAQHKVP